MTDKTRRFNRSLRPVSTVSSRLMHRTARSCAPEDGKEIKNAENMSDRDILIRQMISLYRRKRTGIRRRDEPLSYKRRSGGPVKAERTVFLFLFSMLVLLASVSSMFASVSAYSTGMGIMEPETTWTGTDIFSWPLAIDGRITSGYGIRADPITGEEKMHSGIDIAAAAGTPVLAAAAGTVISADMTDSWGGGYGFHVMIDHGGGISTLYAHCSVLCVTAGQMVQKGEMIARVGSTGNSTGDHLHFEISIDGIRQDPLLFFVSVS